MEYKQPMLPFNPLPKRKDCGCGCDETVGKIVIEIDPRKLVEAILPTVRRHGLHD